MPKTFLIFVIFLGAFLTACQSASVSGEAVHVNGGSYMNVSAAELRVMLDEEDLVLVNVHIPFAGNIPNSDLSISDDQIGAPEYLNQLPAQKDAMIVLYCRSGRMSEIAAAELVPLGYTNVWNLEGGMVDWENAGYEIKP